MGPCWTPIACVALSAALYAAAFPPWALFPLAWIALAPLLLALARVGPIAGLGLGLLWSLLVGLANSWWLPTLIVEYFDAGPVGAWLAAAAATLGTGAWYGVFALLAVLCARGRVIDPLRAALLWGACEFARTVVPIANPWVLSGYTQMPFAAVTQWADVTGVVGVGMLLMAINATAAGWIERRLRPAGGPPPIAATAAVGAILAGVLVYGQVRLGQLYGEGDTVRVHLVQSGIPREQRFEPRHRNRNLAHHVNLVAKAARGEPDLVFLSELAVDVPLNDNSREARALLRIADAADTDLLVGAPAEIRLLASHRLYNSFFVLRGRAVEDRYDKVALTPFSETNPFRGWIDVGLDAYSPGRLHRPVSTRAGPVAVLLCGESMFGAYARDAVQRGAQILSNPANDSWFGTEAAARMQLDIARMRAIETRRPLVRPTMTGVTAVVDAHGRIVAEAEFGGPALLEAEVTPASGMSLYVLWGDWAGWGAVLASTGLVGVQWMVRRSCGSETTRREESVT